MPAASPSGWKPLLIFIGAALLAGAVLSPPLCWAAQAMMKAMHVDATQSLSWPMSEIAKAGFERYFNRAVQVSAIIGLIVLVRKARHGGTAALPPLAPTKQRWAQLAIGFLLAAGLLLALGALYCKLGYYSLRKGAPWTGFGQPITAALGAGIGEELIFRGVILGMMLRATSTRAALLGTTFFFAIIHFLKPPEGYSYPVEQVTWSSGFQVIGVIFAHFGDWKFLLSEFFTLFAVGWVLAWARLRTGSLWASVGLHAGWVFGLKYFSALTRGSKALNHGDYLPWIGENLKVGLTPLVVILFTGFVMSLLLRSENTDSVNHR